MKQVKFRSVLLLLLIVLLGLGLALFCLRYTFRGEAWAAFSARLFSTWATVCFSPDTAGAVALAASAAAPRTGSPGRMGAGSSKPAA